LPTEESFTIEKLVYGGDGLARLDGRVVLTPYVLPGEIIQAYVERVKSDLFRGKLLQVLSPSPSRISPPCPYFLHCGGCHYQHATPEFQLEQKRSILREVLRRVGKIEYSDEIASIAGEPWAYRNRVQLHIANGAVGYFEQGSHSLCRIGHCTISSPLLNDAIAKLNHQAPSVTTTVELFTNETEIQVNVPDQLPDPVRRSLESLGTTGPIVYNGFRVSRNSFFQVNRFLIDALVECAVAGATGATALDLYAGVGLFSAQLADRFEHVTAVEASHSAIRDLRHNLQDRVAIQEAKTEEYLTHVENTPDFVLSDPPRTGLGKEVVRELARIRAPHLAIVSCDPATLARDLQGLLAAGYRIDKITLVDLFPQTFHIETVAHLRL
jgi:23S rRNA (uracil1939-C5)-methyltransferase